MLVLFVLLGFSAVVICHNDHHQEPMEGPHSNLWYNTLPGDGGTQVIKLLHKIRETRKPLNG